MTIVSHHPVIIHFKRVTRCQFAINVNLISFYFQIIIFIRIDDSPVKWKIFYCKLNCCSFFWNGYRAPVIQVPLKMFIRWKNQPVPAFRVSSTVLVTETTFENCLIFSRFSSVSGKIYCWPENSFRSSSEIFSRSRLLD